jgi:hypothetical protein
MNKFFNIGDTLYGFCNGFFGRDDYDNKMCVLVTPMYAVFQYLDGDLKGQAVVINNPDRLNEDMVNEWKKDDEYK